MRYRRLSVRYAMVVSSDHAWPFSDTWPGDRPRLLGQAGWRPDADAYETATTIEFTVDLAGVHDDDVEVQLFDNVLVVDGRRRLPACPEGAIYHAAGIRLGPFQVQLPLPASVDADRVEARFERGLLRITLPKHVEAD